MKGALLVAVVVLLHLAVFAWLPPEALAGYRVASRITFKAATAAACLWAAGTLSPGDYMRPFWTLLGASYLLLTAAEPVVCAALAGGDQERADGLAAAFLLAGNLVSVGASALLAFAYRAAGVGLAHGSRLAWIAVGLVAVAIPGYGIERCAAGRSRPGPAWRPTSATRSCSCSWSR